MYSRVYLLLFGDKSVVLSDTLKGQLFHEIDFVRIFHVLFHEDLNFNVKLRLGRELLTMTD